MTHAYVRVLPPGPAAQRGRRPRGGCGKIENMKKIEEIQDPGSFGSDHQIQEALRCAAEMEVDRWRDRGA